MAAARLAELQAMGPLDLPIAEMREVIGAAETEGVDGARIARAKKKVAYATRVQEQRVEDEKRMAAWEEPTLADSLEMLADNFSYHGHINFDHSMSVLGARVLKN
ncbi:MAG: hypothetical protein SGPRY_000155 [Prymnesium sp.]